MQAGDITPWSDPRPRQRVVFKIKSARNAYAVLDLIPQVGVGAKTLFRGLPALPQALLFVGVPRTRLGYDIVLNPHVENRALF